MSSLLSLQQQFAQDAARLILHASILGFGVTLGEAWRPTETAELNAKKGTGIANSLHCDKLAIDLNLFTSTNQLITDGTGHTELGAWWKALGTDHYWGGDFESRDYNHYSISPNGGMTR